MSRISITPRRVVLASMAVWAVCVVMQWLTNSPLSHDESAYAVLARDGVHTWFYRPIGMVAIARIGITLGGGEIALRATNVMLGVALVPMIAMLGRRFSAWTGAWAAALIAGSHVFLLRGFQLLNDVPVTACMVLAVAILLRELERTDGASYRLAWLAPLFAAALYLRYGSALLIAVVSGAAVLIWWRPLYRRPGPAVVTAALFALLIVPLLAYSAAKTRSPLGIFDMARQAGTYDPGTGLHRFLSSNPFVFYGALLPPVMLWGLVGLFPLRRDRAFLVLVAITLFLWLGTFSDGSARFLFLSMVFLVIVGVDGISRVISQWPSQRLIIRGAAALVAASWLVMLCAAVPIQLHIRRGLSTMTTASAAIRADTAGRRCVVMAYWVPELMWYSGCDGIQAPRWDHLNARPPSEARWYTASMPLHSVDPEVVARAAGATSAVPLSGGTAWRLEHP